MLASCLQAGVAPRRAAEEPIYRQGVFTPSRSRALPLRVGRLGVCLCFWIGDRPPTHDFFKATHPPSLGARRGWVQLVCGLLVTGPLIRGGGSVAFRVIESFLAAHDFFKAGHPTPPGAVLRIARSRESSPIAEQSRQREDGATCPDSPNPSSG